MPGSLLCINKRKTNQSHILPLERKMRGVPQMALPKADMSLKAAYRFLSVNLTLSLRKVPKISLMIRR
jgi:hypothetical protein